MHCHLTPFGIPTVIAVDDPDLAAAVGAAYAEWKAAGPIAAPRITLRLERAGPPSIGVSLDIRVTGSRVAVRGPGIIGGANAATGQGWCILPRRLTEGASALANEAVDALLLFLLARSGRTPLHAAGILLGERALVLTGPSGSGKSTLALAAAYRGLRLLADDMVFVQIEPRLRLWGFPRPIHVFPRDAPHGRHRMRMRAGRLKAALPVPRAATAPHADEGCLILLQRGERLALEPMETEQAIDAMTFDPGFDLLRDQSIAALRALAQHGVWRLSLTRDPGAAIEFLRRHFGTTKATG